MVLQPFVGPLLLFQFPDLFTHSVGILGQGISSSQGRYLNTRQHKHRINVHRHPRHKLDSNPRSQWFEREKTIHALDSSATVIGNNVAHPYLMYVTYLFIGLYKNMIHNSGKVVHRPI
jgi:hypothetical protein